jgi:hypothetical protein
VILQICILQNTHKQKYKQKYPQTNSMDILSGVGKMRLQKGAYTHTFGNVVSIGNAVNITNTGNIGNAVSIVNARTLLIVIL